jgi:tRNA-2-methylthio-N6-dimethylallyladenosine synthase
MINDAAGIDEGTVGLNRRYYIATMGCQMNEYDSEFMGQELMEYGYSRVDDPEKADIALVNTCTVRAKADQKAMSLIGRLIRIKAQNPDLVIGVAGCLAQREGQRLFRRFPQIDMVLGPRELQRFREILEGVLVENRKMIATRLDLPPLNVPPRNQTPGNQVCAYVSIMQGCDNFCTYCIVPYVRGREVSRSPYDILKEAQTLATRGVKEITLLGQNVNSYSWKDGGTSFNFVCLLRMLSDRLGIERLRFTTSHPKDLSDELIVCLKEIEMLCPHIHLPFQAGSDKVLQRMRRGYSREHYLRLVEKLRDALPQIAITSDVMVGFPGETIGDFEQTLDLMEKIRFDGLFSFKYSDRKGTVAAQFEGKIEESEKTCRLERLQGLQKEITLQKNRDLEGKMVSVLIEGESKKGGQAMGRTPTNKIVNLPYQNRMLGTIVEVAIKKAFINSLLAE